MIERGVKDANLHLAYRKDLEILFLRWTAKVGGEQLRRSYLEALDFAKELNVSRWMLDLRGRGGATAEDEAWILNEFFPLAEEALGEHNFFAYLLSPSHYQHIVDNVGLDRLASFSSVTQIQVFMAEADAINWLQEKKELVLEPKNKLR